MDAMTCLVHKMTAHGAGRAHLLPLLPGQRARPALGALPDHGRGVADPSRLRVPARRPSRRLPVRLAEGPRPPGVSDRVHLQRPGAPGGGPDALADRPRQRLPPLPRRMAPVSTGFANGLERALGGLQRAGGAEPRPPRLLLAPAARAAGAGGGPAAGRLQLGDRRDPGRPPRPPAGRGGGDLVHYVPAVFGPAAGTGRPPEGRPGDPRGDAPDGGPGEPPAAAGARAPPGGELHLVPADVRPPHGAQSPPVPAAAQGGPRAHPAERDRSHRQGDRLPLRLRERAVLLPAIPAQDRRRSRRVAPPRRSRLASCQGRCYGAGHPKPRWLTPGRSLHRRLAGVVAGARPPAWAWPPSWSARQGRRAGSLRPRVE